MTGEKSGPAKPAKTVGSKEVSSASHQQDTCVSSSAAGTNADYLLGREFDGDLSFGESRKPPHIEMDQVIFCMYSLYDFTQTKPQLQKQKQEQTRWVYRLV
ncbi:hypothetical protein ASPCADRAFT_788 [Aspergillus carbonarius ITEM 5010]|uniref:Uncharacterized protein n=1 Tax=Aspergillus carbonarius (strain ITEM 5010) TaxID=602072 RepID=A0A1R3S2X0_ASPC5|nr:hypothetical protein ASPCADRAFT_788 [Aspergillus carbonarius ITEM 5010]